AAQVWASPWLQAVTRPADPAERTSSRWQCGRGPWCGTPGRLATPRPIAFRPVEDGLVDGAGTTARMLIVPGTYGPVGAAVAAAQVGTPIPVVTRATTPSDLYSAVTAAIGALKSPLHGGANEAVMHMLEEIGDPARTADWLDGALAAKRKVMGFGHRVHKHGDSRVPIMQAALDELVALAADPATTRLAALHAALREAVLDRKGIHPNLDYPAGLAYHLMGFDTPVFTPLFVMSRITGWTAHITEQLAYNALIRPLACYDGPGQRPVPASA
ncbi:citrate/2-methylcitrate synthase, partial [Kitasatospora sp. NPDC057512]|uniref:citrate/2-methylcitrate synthase n=1 Tax=Kitasatospora sp. NPDC057512 TaxID=3346154 RepID=UPI0036C9BFAB